MNPYDYIIIGSGFGGSVSAMRLTEKGYRVAVLEQGKRFSDNDFPKTNRIIRKYLWLPLLRCFGPQNLAFFKEAFVLRGIGVGGGSLIYANTHMVPPDAFFENPVWASLNDWKKILMPFYDKARFMLGTVPARNLNTEDNILRDIAREMGQEASFKGVNVGVYYGDRDKEVDPYFNGHGPMRKGCIECAGCMVGCRYNAKNTLVKNYLYFAEKSGAQVFPETKVYKIEYRDNQYWVHTCSSTAWRKGESRIFKSSGLVMSAGVVGTLNLLLKQKHQYKTLTALSDRLGKNVRTNSKSIGGVTSAREKLNNGVAITSIFAPDKDTHIELVKFPDKSDGMRLLGVPAAGRGNGFTRTLKLMGNIITHPADFLRMLFNRKWATNSILVMVMQTLDSSMEMIYRKSLFSSGITLVNKSAQRVSPYKEAGQEVARRFAKKVGGIPANNITELMFNMSTADHIMGGCPLGENIQSGVVNKKFEVFGYPRMYIVDGSIIPCNLGVNPSLTITALSEYAMSHVHEKEGNKNKKLDELLKMNTAADVQHSRQSPAS